MNGEPSNRELSFIRKLSRRRGREAEGHFLVEGIRATEELLASDIRPSLAVVTSTLEDMPVGQWLRGRLEEACPVRSVTETQLARLAPTQTPQGVLVVAEQPRHRLESMPEGDPVLVLDGVQDPGNAGTLVRTAEAFGVGFLIALPGTVDPWNPKVVRAAAGSLFRVPVVSAALEDGVEWLQARGYRILGSAAGAEPVEGALPRRAALVVGNEGAGLREETAAVLDAQVAIPMRGRVDSLNVAMAAGILLFLMTGES